MIHTHEIQNQEGPTCFAHAIARVVNRIFRLSGVGTNENYNRITSWAIDCRARQSETEKNTQDILAVMIREQPEFIPQDLRGRIGISVFEMNWRMSNGNHTQTFRTYGTNHHDSSPYTKDQIFEDVKFALSRQRYVIFSFSYTTSQQSVVHQFRGSEPLKARDFPCFKEEDEMFRHAVVLVRWEDGILSLKNSWGRHYGDNGLLLLHEDMLSVPGFSVRFVDIWIDGIDGYEFVGLTDFSDVKERVPVVKPELGPSESSMGSMTVTKLYLESSSLANDSLYALNVMPRFTVTGSKGGRLVIWEEAGNEQRGHVLPGHTLNVRVIMPIDNSQLVTVSDDETVRRWNLVTNRSEILCEDVGSIRCAMLTADKTSVIFGTQAGHILLLDVNTRALAFIGKHDMRCWSIVEVALLSSNQDSTEEKTLLATASSDTSIKLWELKPETLESIPSILPRDCATVRDFLRGLPSGSPVQVLQEHVDSVYCVATISIGVLASGCADGSIKLWTLPTIESLSTGVAATAVVTLPTHHLSAVTSLLVVSTTTNHQRPALLSADKSSRVVMWDLQSLTATRCVTLEGSGGILALEKTLHGTAVAACADGSLRRFSGRLVVSVR